MKTKFIMPLPWTPARDRKTQRVTPKRMREVNSEELLRLLRAHAPCSRADLVRHSGMTAPTVSAAINDLQRRGLIKFLGDGVSNGGRPPALLEFNAEAGYVVGVDIGGSTVRLALADLSGKMLQRSNVPLKANRTPEYITDVIAAGVAEMTLRLGSAAKKVLAIGAGAPGITDAKSGIVLSAPNLSKWDNVPLREMLREKTRVSATIENDVNLAALGESFCGVAKGYADFVFLAVGTGVGAGIVVNGRLHHGADWSAGEIGYMLIPELSDAPLAINRLGALESAIGGTAIEHQWKKMMGAAHAANCSDIFRKASEGHKKAQALLKQTARHLAAAITNLSLILDTSLVVLGGGVGSNPALLDATTRLISQNQFARPKLVASSLGVEAQLHGAVHLALQLAEAQGFHKQQAKAQSGY